MKTFILFSVVLAEILAAPTKDEEVSGPLGENKSALNGPPAEPYGQAPAPPPAMYGPPPTPAEYGYQPASVYPHAASYPAPGGHLTSLLNNRAANLDDSQVWNTFMPTDHEDQPQARFYRAYGPAAGAYTGGPTQAAQSGPALGLFPNANIGGCAIPLLVSCSPSISKGQIMKSQHASYSAPSYGYRNIDFDTQIRMHEDAMQKAAEQQAQWSEMERDAAATGMGQMHQPNVGVHVGHSSNGLHDNHMHFLSHDAHNSPYSQIQGPHSMNNVFTMPGQGNSR